jgi:hypothetical protein
VTIHFLTIVHYIIKSRSVFFVLAQRLKTETQLRSTTGRSTKRASTMNDIKYTILSSSALSVNFHVKLSQNGNF